MINELSLSLYGLYYAVGVSCHTRILRLIEWVGGSGIKSDDVIVNVIESPVVRYVDIRVPFSRGYYAIALHLDESESYPGHYKVEMAMVDTYRMIAHNEKWYINECGVIKGLD